MGSQARDEHIRRHKAGLISVLVNAPETAQQAEAHFKDILARKGCPTKYIEAHLEDARTRATEGRKKLGRS